MERAREAYETRAEEIDAYFDFLYDLSARRAELTIDDPDATYTPGQDLPRISRRISSQVIETMKANGFLLLYNLVEATMRLAMEGIHTDIERHGHHFDELRPELKKHILTLFRKGEGIDRIVLEAAHPISRSILAAGFRGDRLFSGNVHHDVLEKLAEKIGFSTKTDNRTTQGGRRLERVKTRRNELAHGELSFFACGQSTPIEELIAIKKEVVAYVGGILDNIDLFLQEAGYLANPVSRSRAEGHA